MSYNILLVDDDREFRKEFISYFDNYNIIEVSNGNDAVRIIESPNNIDLVILDVMIPGMKGTSVLKKIKELNSELKVIIITGYSSKDVAIDSLKGKADDYIEKPANPVKIQESIDKFINRNYEIEDFSINSKIEKIKDFIQRNSDKIISLDDVSKIVFLSPKYLSRVFKEMTGTGFKDYILKIKTDEAKKLLVETGHTINEIASKLGYKNAESFIRLFKNETNMTPTEFRKDFAKS
jgi:two-component system, response regulator YesN